MTDAKEFYGATVYNRCKNQSQRGFGTRLDDAVHWLDKAIVFELAGDATKTEMALKAALKSEKEGIE